MSDQTTFRTALLDPELATPPGLLDGHGGPAGRRFSVYRNNVAASLIEALEQSFPIIQRLIGPENFTQLARIFYRAHPPTSPILSHYGDALAGFLEGFEPLAHLGYLPDMARLERGLIDSYHSADGVPVDPGFLGQIPPQDLPALTLRLAPPVILIRSAWPIHGIWQYNTEPGAPQPPAQAQDVLITRPGYDPIPRLLGPGGGEFIGAIMQNASLGAAAEIATAAAPDFDLSAMLGLLLQGNALNGAPTPSGQ